MHAAGTHRPAARGVRPAAAPRGRRGAMTRILILEHQPELRSALERPLAQVGYTLLSGTLESQPTADLIVAPLAAGTALLESRCRLPVVLIAEQATPRCIVDAMKLGAADFLVRPFEAMELVASIERVLEEHRQPITTRGGVFDSPIAGMIGRCTAMRALFAQIHKVAPVESTVLIQGESGTGKELVARALHAHSSRRNAPIISLNCAAIPESLIESELFGHERGAFTGANQARAGLVEAADGGTLFLDEIGELPLEAQARLLRVLQHGEVRRLGSVHTKQINVRLIAATHRDLRQLIANGLFREDLYYRLNVVTLALPPLRERRDDIPELVQYVLQRTCIKLNKRVPGIEPAALQAMLDYHWPGNVRELENALERAVILCDTDQIPLDLLALEQPNEQLLARTRELNTPPADTTTLDDYFINFVQQHQQAMTETELAARLGISRKSLWERRQRFKVPRTRTPKRGVRNHTL